MQHVVLHTKADEHNIYKSTETMEKTKLNKTTVEKR